MTRLRIEDFARARFEDALAKAQAEGNRADEAACALVLTLFSKD